MKIAHKVQHASLPVLLFLLSCLLALLLSACGTLQIGVEGSGSPVDNTPSATVPPAATATIQPVDRVNIFLVAMEDNGRSGKKIGCGDSLVAVERQIAPTQEPLKAALQELFSIKDRMYGQSGLYNSLYQSDLRVDSISLQDGKATVNLSGQHALGGVCDDPRFVAQITETVLQFPEVKEAAIFINGTPLEQFLSEKG